MTGIGRIGTELEAFCNSRGGPYFDFNNTVGRAVQSTEQERDEICKALIEVADALPQPARPPQKGPRLCPSAKRLVSSYDDGHVNYIATNFLAKDEKEMLKRSGGCFQYWKCAECQHETKYYVRESNCSTLLKTREQRSYGKGNASLYRAALLAKSHLDKSYKSMRYACLLCMADGKEHPDRMVFTDEKQLLSHLSKYHCRESLPDTLMRALRFANVTEPELETPPDFTFPRNAAS